MKQHSWIFLPLVLLLAAGAQAQTPATTGADSVALSFAHLDLGASGLEGDCVELETSNPGGGAVIADLRLAACAGQPAGTLLRDSDVVELGAPATNPALSLAYADANANGRYDPGDFVYLDTDPAAGLTPSTSAAAFTLRVTAAMAHPAGTFAHAGDSDLQAFGTAAATFATASLAWVDRDGSVTFTPGDVAYLLPSVAPGYPAGSLLPLGSLRLTAAPSPDPATATSAPTPTATATASPTPTQAPSPTAVPTPAATSALPTSEGPLPTRQGSGTITVPALAWGSIAALLGALAALRRI